MKQTAMEKLVGKQLPEIKLIENQLRHQTEVKAQREVRAKANDGLHDKHPDVGDQQKLHRRRHTDRRRRLICRV